MKRIICGYVVALLLGATQFAQGQAAYISAQLAEGTPIEMVSPDSTSVDVFFHLLVDDASKVASIEVKEGSEAGLSDLQQYELQVREENGECYLEGNWIENNRIRFPHTVSTRQSATFGFITITIRGKAGVADASVQYTLTSL